MASSRQGSVEPNPANNTRFLIISICLGLSILVVLFCGLHATRDATSANRTFGLSILMISLLSVWIARYFETRKQFAAWQVISQKLGLNISVSGYPFRMKTVISGKYQGRMIWLYSARCGKDWQPGARVEIELPEPTEAVLSLWGPYEFDDISPSMIKSGVKRFGGKRICFFKTNNPLNERHLVRSSVRQALLDLKYEVKIEVNRDLLVSEQTETVYHPDTLIQQINLLSDLAHHIIQWPTSAVNAPVPPEGLLLA